MGLGRQRCRSIGRWNQHAETQPRSSSRPDRCDQHAAGPAAHTLALKSDGTVWGWGYNGYGELGDGSNTTRFNIVRASDLTSIIAIAGVNDHSLAVKSDGTVFSWDLTMSANSAPATSRNGWFPVR